MQLWNSVQKGKIWAFFSNKKEWKKIFFIEIKGTWKLYGTLDPLYFNIFLWSSWYIRVSMGNVYWYKIAFFLSTFWDLFDIFPLQKVHFINQLASKKIYLTNVQTARDLSSSLSNNYFFISLFLWLPFHILSLATQDSYLIILTHIIMLTNIIPSAKAKRLDFLHTKSKDSYTHSSGFILDHYNLRPLYPI